MKSSLLFHFIVRVSIALNSKSPTTYKWTTDARSAHDHCHCHPTNTISPYLTAQRLRRLALVRVLQSGVGRYEV